MKKKIPAFVEFRIPAFGEEDRFPAVFETIATAPVEIEVDENTAFNIERALEVLDAFEGSLVMELKKNPLTEEEMKKAAESYIEETESPESVEDVILAFEMRRYPWTLKVEKFGAVKQVIVPFYAK